MDKNNISVALNNIKEMLIIIGAKCKRCDSKTWCLGCVYSEGEGLYVLAELTALLYKLDKDSVIETFDDIYPTSIFETPDELVDYFVEYYIKPFSKPIADSDSDTIITLRKQEDKLLQNNFKVLKGVILSEEPIIYEFANNRQVNSHKAIDYMDGIMRHIHH